MKKLSKIEASVVKVLHHSGCPSTAALNPNIIGPGLATFSNGNKLLEEKAGLGLFSVRQQLVIYQNLTFSYDRI